MLGSDFTLAVVLNELDSIPPIEVADAIEFRMDHCTDPLVQLNRYEGDLPIIATNRAPWEGGSAADGPERLEMLADVIALPHVAAVDIELRSLKDGDGTMVKSLAADHGVDTIVSWHDFDQTPSRSELTERLHTAATSGTVGKCAVQANSREDVLRLLSVTHELHQSGHRIATMSMGSIGKHSRVILPLYGSEIGYAPVDIEAASAPGQIELEMMATFLDALQ